MYQRRLGFQDGVEEQLALSVRAEVDRPANGEGWGVTASRATFAGSVTQLGQRLAVRPTRPACLCLLAHAENASKLTSTQRSR